MIVHEIHVLKVDITQTESDALSNAAEILHMADEALVKSGTNTVITETGEIVCTEADIRSARATLNALANNCVIVGK